MTGASGLVLSRADVAALTSAQEWDNLIEAFEQSMLDVDGGQTSAEVSFSAITASSGMLISFVTALLPGGSSARLLPGPGSASGTVAGLRIDSDGALRTVVSLYDLNVLRTSLPVTIGVKHFALLGSGVQARGQVAAILRVMPGLDPLALTDVIRGARPARASPPDRVIFELGGRYVWDDASLRWLDGWGRANSVGDRNPVRVGVTSVRSHTRDPRRGRDYTRGS